MLIPDQPLIRNHFYLITWYHAVFALTPLRLRTCGFMPRGRARGQNLEHLRIFFIFFSSCMELFVFEQQVLLRELTLSVTSDLRVYCPGVVGWLVD